jgi:RNA polymerase sigma factor (sigma-70 family)
MQKSEKEILSLQDFDRIKECTDESLDPENASEILQYLLGQLPKTDRLVLTLMYFDDCSTEEIADRINSSRAAVKMRIMRARKRIKKIAEDENIFGKSGWTS